MEQNSNPKTGADFEEIIAKLDASIHEILDCFENIGIRDFDENEDLYFKRVGEFSALLKKLLNVYFENEQNRELQLKYKPDILYYRQVQGYLVFLLRFPEIIQVKDHDEIEQTINFLENKEFLIKQMYVNLAKQETELFEGNFRNELEKMLKRRAGND